MQHTEYFQTLARYNQWMNEKLYAVCASASDETRRRDTGAPFQSMSGVLNHLLLADRMWLSRFKYQPHPFKSLDQELYADFEELTKERKITDEEINAWVAALTDEKLLAPLTYTSMVNPTPRSQPLWFCMLHMFNHQTHHRGQLTAMIEQAGFDCGITDLLYLSLLD